MYSKVYGLVNSNMLPEFSRKQRQLSWQPKLSRNKIAQISVMYKIWRQCLRVWQGRIQICCLNFAGSKGRCHGNKIEGKMS